MTKYRCYNEVFIISCYMPFKFLASFFFFCLFSAKVMAGGSYFAVNISEIKHDGFEFYLVAELLGTFNYDNSGCKKIEVAGYFDSQMWKKHSKLIDEKVHTESLKLIENAFENREQINLGYIGNGFFKTGLCKYTSKGLFNDANGVYSIYAGI